MASLTVVQLREALAKRKLDTGGLKATLLSRLQVALDKEDACVEAELETTSQVKDFKPPSKSPFAIKKTFQGRRDGRSFKESRLMSSKKFSNGKRNTSEASNVSQDGVFQLDLEQELEDNKDHYQEYGTSLTAADPDIATVHDTNASTSYCEDDAVDNDDVSNWVEDNDTNDKSTFDEAVSKYKSQERRQSYGDKSAPINIVLSRNSTKDSGSIHRKTTMRQKSIEAISER